MSSSPDPRSVADLTIELMRPLWKLGHSATLNNAQGHAELIKGYLQDGWVDALIGWYAVDKANAPDRTARGKRYINRLRTGRPSKSPKSENLVGVDQVEVGGIPDRASAKRTEEHLMMAMFNQVELHVPGSSPMRVVDYQTPLFSAQRPIRERQIGKIDGLGILGDGTLCLMELKSPAEGYSGESPLKAMFEGLAYAAVEEKFHQEFCADIVRLADNPDPKFDRFRGSADGRPTVLVVGPRSWWEVWERYEDSGICEWKTNLRDLSMRLADGMGPLIRFASLEPFSLSELVFGTKETGAAVPGPVVLEHVDGLPGL